MTLLRLGETVRLTATVHEPDGRIISAITANWESEDEPVVTVDAAGLVTAVGTGVATVRAGAEGLEASSTARVDLHRGVLVAALGGPEWVHNRHRGTDDPIGSRWGVSTDSAGNVVKLSLAGNELAGTIPAESGALETLEGLTGPIPPESAVFAVSYTSRSTTPH